MREEKEGQVVQKEQDRRVVTDGEVFEYRCKG